MDRAARAIHMSNSINQKISELRQEYRKGSLLRENLDSDPFAQFEKWFSEAVNAEIPDANAMTLATIGLDGTPNARTVLMKEFTGEGVAFFTNRHSNKGKELAASPVAALLFFWKELERQVHVRGDVAQTTHGESQAYFFSRPYDARIGAWASLQSEEIPEREWLSKRVSEFEAKYPDNGEPDCVPLPEHWGGYRVIPHTIEFWQGQPGRKHDRFLYTRADDGEWTPKRLSP